MQPTPPPPPGTGRTRSRFGVFLALGVLALIVAAGVGGYLVGSAGIGHATLRIQVTNNLNTNATVQVTVNGALASTLSIPAGQTGTVDVPVAFATSNGASFDVEARATQGPNDSSTILVNTPGIFVVTLRLG